MAFKNNIKQSDIILYLVDKFNTNYYGIPFSYGFYKFYGNNGVAEGLNIFWYKPRLNDKGLFDINESFDDETFVATKKRITTMDIQVSAGEYSGLPNVRYASFTADIEFLVYADDPLILQATKEAIEEIRNNSIGVEEIYEMSVRNESSVDSEYVKIVTNANGIDYGSLITVKGRNFMVMSMQIDITAGINVEFGNQATWKIGKYSDDDVLGTEYEVIPIISSFGVNQDLEPMQFLNGFTVEQQEKARQIHNYVKSRGFALTMTFFVDFSDIIIRDLFRQTFIKPELPPSYHVTTQFTEYVGGVATYPSDLLLENDYIYGDATIDSIQYGDVMIMSIGFAVGIVG